MINIHAWLPKISATNYTHQQWNNMNESMGRVFLEEITLTELVEEFLIFNGIWRLLIKYTSHKPPKPQESRPKSKLISLISILISSFHLHLRIPSGTLHRYFPTKIWNVFLISAMHTTCTGHLLLLLNLMTLILQIMNLLITQFLQTPATFLLHLNIQISTLFSQLIYNSQYMHLILKIFLWHTSYPCIYS